jgi:hypothetical protein
MVKQSAPSGLRVASATSEVAWITAKMDQEKDEILLRVLPTDRAGRFESVVTLRYNDPKVPSFKLTVSGLVGSN